MNQKNRRLEYPKQDGLDARRRRRARVVVGGCLLVVFSCVVFIFAPMASTIVTYWFGS